MAGAALGRGVPVKGHCPRAAFPGTVLHACPTTGCPGRARLALPGRFDMERKREREKERQAEAGRSFRQGCSGVLRAGVKVHRGKGRVRGLEGGGHDVGAQASSRQRGIPQKRPLELHREGEKEQERKREGESVASQREVQDEQTWSQGGGGWAATQQVTGCGQAFGRGATASQDGASELLPTGSARLRGHGVRAPLPSLTHASCAVLVGLKAPAAALVAAAAVPAIGVDADRLVPGADKGELGALVRVCKRRGLSVKWLGWELRAGGPSGGGCAQAMPPALSTALSPLPMMPQSTFRAVPRPCAKQAAITHTQPHGSPACTPSHLPAAGCCPPAPSIPGAGTPVRPAATHLHSVHSCAGRIPARTTFGEKQRLLRWGGISPGQPLSQQSSALHSCLPPCAHTQPSPPAGQA